MKKETEQKEIEQKEKDNIFMVSQIMFTRLSPDFKKPFQKAFSEELGFKYNLNAKRLSSYTSCVKRHRGINKETFPISPRNTDIVKLIADLTISELEDLINLNNSDKDFDLHKYLKEENNENKS